jgi:hypothetical protein
MITEKQVGEIAEMVIRNRLRGPGKHYRPGWEDAIRKAMVDAAHGGREAIVKAAHEVEREYSLRCICGHYH